VKKKGTGEKKRLLKKEDKTAKNKFSFLEHPVPEIQNAAVKRKK
jgi:hypothetical protein